MIGNHINEPRYPPLQVYGKSTNQNRCNQQQRDSGWMDIYHDIRRLYWLQMQEQSSGEKTHTERCLGSFLVAKFYLKSVFYLHFTCIMLSRCSTMDFFLYDCDDYDDCRLCKIVSLKEALTLWFRSSKPGVNAHVSVLLMIFPPCLFIFVVLLPRCLAVISSMGIMSHRTITTK